ncbi:MAG: Na+:solute symporter [Bacteroidales bacterium]|nr:Na+:solute symporter [Bacteroidales bacterium]MBN2820957.1 Na+:solute symporter [Bacteroidales bacterium]
MKLRLTDILIILVYLASTVVIGLVIKKRAQKDKSAYLLGGNKLPWWMLGLSNASGMFDISGTMWLVAVGFLYGLKSIWLPWMWPVFNQVFLMVYLSAWIRKANVTTGAEWMKTRFGYDRGAELSHNIVVAFAILLCLGMLAYGFVGLGKFVEIFIPWEVVSQYVPFSLAPANVPHFYAIVFTAFAVFYTILGGMTSIVWADFLQFIIMTVASVVIAIMAMNALDSPLHVPEGWSSPFFGMHLNLDWTGIVDKANFAIREHGMQLFGFIFSMMLLKGILVSGAGPAPNYDMQKILATKSPSEAAKMSGFVSVVLNPTRYLMITGFVVLGLVFFDKLDLIVGGKTDFEQILPSAINEFAPAGFLGLILAGLLAAFMSTFAGTLNAAQAYLVNDVYIKYLKPNPSKSQLMFANYSVGILIVLLSIVIGAFATNINSLLQWIVSGIYGGFIAANVLKWYWWRFNGHGYFWGMVAGLVSAMIFPKILPPLFPDVAEQIILLYFFPLMLALSLIGCIAGTLLSSPTDEKTLKEFYANIRPWGFWKPIYEKVKADYPHFEKNTNFKKDMLNILVGIVGQTAIVAMPIFFVIKNWGGFFITLAIIAVTVTILKFTWWDKLEEFNTDYTVAPK